MKCWADVKPAKQYYQQKIKATNRQPKVRFVSILLSVFWKNYWGELITQQETDFWFVLPECLSIINAFHSHISPSAAFSSVSSSAAFSSVSPSTASSSVSSSPAFSSISPSAVFSSSPSAAFSSISPSAAFSSIFPSAVFSSSPSILKQPLRIYILKLNSTRN